MDVEGILAIILIFGGGTLFLLSVSPVGKAYAHRIRSRGGESVTDPAILEELDELRQDVAELQERVDFTERMLSQKNDLPEIGSGETRPEA